MYDGNPDNWDPEWTQADIAEFEEMEEQAREDELVYGEDDEDEDEDSRSMADREWDGMSDEEKEGWNDLAEYYQDHDFDD